MSYICDCEAGAGAEAEAGQNGAADAPVEGTAAAGAGLAGSAADQSPTCVWSDGRTTTSCTTTAILHSNAIQHSTTHAHGHS